MKYSTDERRLYALAQELSMNGNVGGVAEKMRELVGRRPDSAVFAALLANALDCLGHVDEAEQYFKTAVSLAPHSEKFSLGLFHCLWDQGKQIEALDEMKRFISGGGESADYREILSELPK